MKQYEVNIGKACNNACVFCSNGVVPLPERTFVPLESVVSEIRQAAAQGYDAIGFLGGEPTLRKDLVEILKVASGVGFQRITLCTNGRRLKNRAYLEELLDAGLSRVTLSFHSHVESVENAICRRKRAYAEKVAAVENLVAVAHRLEHGLAINSCIHGANWNRLVEQSAFFAGLGIREIRFNWLRPEALVWEQPRWAARLSRLKWAIRRVVQWNEGRGGLVLTFSDVPWCAYPEEFWAMPDLLRRYVGELRDLSTWVVVHREAGRDVFSWAERRRERLKGLGTACSGCVVRQRCEGVWQSYLALFGEDEIQPVHRRDALEILDSVWAQVERA